MQVSSVIDSIIGGEKSEVSVLILRSNFKIEPVPALLSLILSRFHTSLDISFIILQPNLYIVITISIYKNTKMRLLIHSVESTVISICLFNAK